MGFEKGHNPYYIKGKPPSRKGAKHTEETKKKMSASERANPRGVRFKKGVSQNVGEEHPNWKGGITSLNSKIRGSMEYRLWRTSVFTRDNKTCIWCGSQENIEADHIKPFAYYPELRFAIDNGRTLCRDCHKTTATYCIKRWRYIVWGRWDTRGRKFMWCTFLIYSSICFRGVMRYSKTTLLSR